MTTTNYLLDTNIILAMVRKNPLGRYLEATYPLRGASNKPRISAVTKGEILALARRFGWGAVKLHKLDQSLLDEVVPVEINRDDIIDAYVEIDCASLTYARGSIKMGKNDLWIAATARARNSTLLTTDKDFDHLHPALIQRSYIDPTSTLPPPPLGTP